MSHSRNTQRMLRAGALLSLIIVGCARASAFSRHTPLPSRVTEIPQAGIEAAVTHFGTAYDIAAASASTFVHGKRASIARLSRPCDAPPPSGPARPH